MRDLQTFDQRLATIGYRLQTRAGDLCANRVPIAGLAVQDISQYAGKEQEAARRAFGFDGYPTILTVAADSPAAAVGVRADDAIIAIDGTPVGRVTRPAASSARRVAAITEAIERAADDGVITLGLRRTAKIHESRIVLQRGCPTRFQTSTTDSLDAAADGEAVQIDIGAMRFAGDDAQIAAIAAHELAHNILRHQQRLAAAGVRNTRGARGVRLTREAEDEADRLSVYLLDRAGYPPSAATIFWTRLRDAPGRRVMQHVHGTPAARIAMLDAEIARIAAMKAAGLEPRPDFLESGDLPALR